MQAGLAPLAGRDAELARLAAVVARADSASGGFVVVSGPAGIGKTRLLAEAARLAGERGGRVLSARGTELERHFSLGVPRQLFEWAVASVGVVQRQEWLAGAAAPATALLGAAGDAGGAGGAGGAGRPVGDFAILHGLYWLTANMCRRRLLMLVVDDLHWLDAGSLRFLAYLLPRLEGLRLVVVAATRPHEPVAEQRLLDLLLSDQSCLVLRPEALSPADSAVVVQAALDGQGDAPFLSACHAATGGNPLLLRELAVAVAGTGLPATAEHVAEVWKLGTRALSARVDLQLASLPAGCAALAQAVTIMGDDVPVGLAAKLAGLDGQQASEAANQLEQLQILRVDRTGRPVAVTGWLLAFVHPLVRAAVHDRLDPSARLRGHTTAARLLQQADAEPERVATHLLHVPPRGDVQVVDTLLSAAKHGLRRGSPDTAVVYLERCLQEPLLEHERLDVLEELGMTARAVDNGLAADYLSQAITLATEPIRRARIAHVLGDLYMMLLRADQAAAVWADAISRLPAGEEDLRRRLVAGLMHIAAAEPGALRSRATVAAALRLGPHDSVGGRSVESLIGLHLAQAADPGAAEHARRALSGGLLVEHSSVFAPVSLAWAVLLYADDPDVMGDIETALSQARRRGRINDLANGLLYKTHGHLRQGDLVQAEAAGRECMRMTDMSGIAITRPILGAFLSETLLELGRPAEAGAVLDWVGLPEPVPSHGPMYIYLEARARLLRAMGQPELALRFARSAGERFAAHGGDNPAFAAWRSEAALCLSTLGQSWQALALAEEELALAERWAAPWALGRALRVTGLVLDPAGGVPLLRRAVSVLEKSPARLEFAKAAVHLGTALRRTGRVDEARDFLANGLDLARHCQALDLVGQAEADLRATGMRLPRRYQVGPATLTASERRVVELAIVGRTNREIAQELYVTIKTVEVHLSSAYRKLRIRRRTQLRAALPTEHRKPIGGRAGS